MCSLREKLIKTVLYGILLLLLAFVPVPDGAAVDITISDEQVLIEKGRSIIYPRKPGKYKEYYRTWNVVDVTEDMIFLERTKKNGDIVKAGIDRSRRPHLEVGDRVRYDSKRNRLGKTLDK